MSPNTKILPTPISLSTAPMSVISEGVSKGNFFDIMTENDSNDIPSTSYISIYHLGFLSLSDPIDH